MKTTAVVGLACALVVACNSSVPGRQQTDAVIDSGVPAAPQILTTTIPDALEGENYGVALETSGGALPLTFAIVAQTNTSWLGLTPDSGVLFGTAPQSLTSGSVTVQLSDALARSTQTTLAVSVVACRPGDTRPCDDSDGGICVLGAQACQGGVLTACQLSLASNRADQCGDQCESCSLQGGDACVDGACVCGDAGTACSGAESSCCGGGCTDLASDPHNCKACGNDCAAPGRVPANSQPGCGQEDCAYACIAPFDDCNANVNSDGCETNLQTDKNHCGTCGTACTPGGAVTDTFCDAGSCAVKTCQAPYADCDHSWGNGCETDTSSNTNNCGACGNICTKTANVTGATSCVASTCKINSGACQAPFMDCDGQWGNGCEANTSNDVNHCGGCSPCVPPANTHVTSAACSGSACVVASCATDFDDCDQTWSNGCETSLKSDSTCGSCNNDCTARPPVGGKGWICNQSTEQCQLSP